MAEQIILASGSSIRATLLRNAGLAFDVVQARVDEKGMRDSLLAEDATPRDIADTLAELKAIRVSGRHRQALVIGCDQVLALGDLLLSKAETIGEARDQLVALRNRTHKLLSAVVICQDGAPVWRHVGEVRLTMRGFADAWLDDYLARNWDSVRDAVGCYKLEEEGVRLFTRIEGDYFTVLGLPLLELLSYLALRGTIES
ncbi:MAG: Maf family protein [Rhodobacterales bacterium]|nr:Maf family protein [Rhodobacterales bacterium]